MAPFPPLETLLRMSMEWISALSEFKMKRIGEVYCNNFSLLLRDRDQDNWSANCGQTRRAGWWHRACNLGQPTGLSTSTMTNGSPYITWMYGGQRGNSWNSWPEALYVLVPN